MAGKWLVVFLCQITERPASLSEGGLSRLRTDESPELQQLCEYKHQTVVSEHLWPSFGAVHSLLSIQNLLTVKPSGLWGQVAWWVMRAALRFCFGDVRGSSNRGGTGSEGLLCSKEHAVRTYLLEMWKKQSHFEAKSLFAQLLSSPVLFSSPGIRSWPTTLRCTTTSTRSSRCCPWRSE